MMRLLNICVIAALVLAAADVYKIKFEVDAAGRARRQAAHARSGASTTPSRRCARNGRSSTIPRASRGWRGGICTLKPVEGAADRQARPPAGAAARARAGGRAPIRSATMIANPEVRRSLADRQRAARPSGDCDERARQPIRPATRRERTARAVAPAAGAHAALRPQRRPRRQGAGAHRARDARLRDRSMPSSRRGW